MPAMRTERSGCTPIFILGVHKSGTSLLRNLLDGHPMISAVPIELHFPMCHGLPVAYPRRRCACPGDQGKAARIARMEELVKSYDRSKDARADAFLPGRFDMAVFKAHLEQHLAEEPDASDLFHYAHATALSLGEAWPDDRPYMVEKSVDNIEHAWWLKHLYPDARFLFILRDPRANLVSFRKFIATKGSYPSMVQPLRTIEMGFHYAALYSRTLPDMHLLRYEDLLTDTRSVMEGIARFLAIPWNEVLLSPTTLGGSWKGNSTTGVAMTGVSAAQLDHWKTQIEPIEQHLIARSSLAELMPLFGYGHVTPVPGWPRAKGEGFKTYIRNRVYRLFADGS